MTVKFFLTPVYPYGNDHYYHEIIGLIEGFIELGHTVIGNASYWLNPDDNNYLIHESRSKDYDLGIYDYRYAASFAHLLFRKNFPNKDKGAKHVLIDRNDGINPIWERDQNYLLYFDLICSGNLFKSKSYHKKVKPWAIGLTNRQITAIEESSKSEIKRQIGYNFRVGHNMRKLVFENLSNLKLPYSLVSERTHGQADSLSDVDQKSQFYNEASTGRHHPAYFEKLNQNLLFLAFGGYLDYSPIRYRPYSIEARIRRKINHLKRKLDKHLGNGYRLTMMVYQQDNFRFWECLCSNTCPISLHTDFWDYLLPVEPGHKQHYLGIQELDANNLAQDLTEFNEELIASIGQEGKRWVLDEYSPKAQATRVLNWIDL